MDGSGFKSTLRRTQDEPCSKPINPVGWISNAHPPKALAYGTALVDAAIALSTLQKQAIKLR